MQVWKGSALSCTIHRISKPRRKTRAQMWGKKGKKTWLQQGSWDAAAHKTPCFLTRFSSTWTLSQEVFPKRSCPYAILHVVATLKAVTFALTAVSTKNLKQYVRPPTYDGWTCQFSLCSKLPKPRLELDHYTKKSSQILSLPKTQPIIAKSQENFPILSSHLTAKN